MNSTPALAFESARSLVRKIRAREVGSRELLEHYLARGETYGAAVNCIVVHDIPSARQRADQADRALARGDMVGPLHGLPMTIKESFHLTGTPTTFGFPQFRNNIATSNAVVVDRLLAAGAVIFGKTNVPPALMDGQSNNEVYGRTNNPWDLKRTPGGSSGGSAAALAAGLTGLELGSDIASSIRNPSHYCGVYGHKPTYGVCPQDGHMLLEWHQATDIAVVGPMARSAHDLELALSVMAGPAEDHGIYSLELPAARQTTLKDFRIALVVDDAFAEVDQAVQDQLTALGEFLAREGASVTTGARPEFDSRELYQLYMVLLRAAASLRIPDDEFNLELERARGADRATRDMSKLNAYGATLSHRDWLRLDEERQLIRNKWREFFARFDLLLCPPLSSAAFPHSSVPPQARTLAVNGRDVPFENQLFWAGFAGIAYLPATVAPIGLTGEGLPVGVQIIGPRHGDRTCLRFAQLLEERYRAFIPPPGFAG
jgi:amidase